MAWVSQRCRSSSSSRRSPWLYRPASGTCTLAAQARLRRTAESAPSWRPEDSRGQRWPFHDLNVLSLLPRLTRYHADVLCPFKLRLAPRAYLGWQSMPLLQAPHAQGIGGRNTGGSASKDGCSAVWAERVRALRTAVGCLDVS